MSASCEIDLTGWHRATESLSAALLGSGHDVSEILADETKRLSRQIMNFTPPMKQKKLSEDTPDASAKKIGEMAIQRDLSKLYSEADTKLIDEVGSQHGLANISVFITDKDGSKKFLRWDTIDPEGSRMSATHSAFLAGGRTLTRLKSNQHTWAARNIVPRGAIAKLQAQLIPRVGRWKASWAQLAIKLGDRLPQWIAGHNVKNISRADDGMLHDNERPSLTFGSSAPGVQLSQADVQKAVYQRMGNILKRVQKVLHGYKYDIGNGHTCKPRAKESNLQ
jgi:hypothetical protein